MHWSMYHSFVRSATLLFFMKMRASRKKQEIQSGHSIKPQNGQITRDKGGINVNSVLGLFIRGGFFCIAYKSIILKQKDINKVKRN